MGPIATSQLPALVKANNYTFYTLDNGEYDLRKMYQEWRSRLSHYEVPRLCRLDHAEHRHNHAPQTSRLPALPDAGRQRRENAQPLAVNQAIKHRLAQHSASSPPTDRVALPVGKKVPLQTSRQPLLHPVTNTMENAKIPGKNFGPRTKIKTDANSNTDKSRVGRFDQVSKIGQGSYGTVFKCHDRTTDTVVAIKRFLETDEKSDIRKIAFREIRILKQLRHPNIVTLLEVFRRKKRLHLVFEYCDRTLLDEIQRTQNGISSGTAQRIIHELLQAVHAIHRHRSLHRDIKPENILLTERNQVKLCDFGFARTMSNAENDFYTDYVATRWYRAPELLSASTPDGKEYYGPGVDIWAVGCVFYECLNKSPLFPGKTDIDQLWLIEEAFGTGKREHVPDTPKIMAHDCRDDRIEYAARDNFAIWHDKLKIRVPEDCRAIIGHILQIDPARRPSAGDLLDHPYFHQTQTETNINDAGLKKQPETSLIDITPGQAGTAVSTPDIEPVSMTKNVERNESKMPSRNRMGNLTLDRPRSVQKLPKISSESVKSIMSVRSLELPGSTIATEGGGAAISKPRTKAYALRRSLSRPNFLPTIY